MIIALIIVRDLQQKNNDKAVVWRFEATELLFRPKPMGEIEFLNLEEVLFLEPSTSANGTTPIGHE
jgi:hypothetical protein